MMAVSRDHQPLLVAFWLLSWEFIFAASVVRYHADLGIGVRNGVNILKVYHPVA